MAEGDRDVYRRSQAALAREKEIMKDVDGWEVGYPLLGPALLSALGGVLSSSVALAEMNGSPSADRQICLQHQEVHAIDYCCLIESSTCEQCTRAKAATPARGDLASGILS